MDAQKPRVSIGLPVYNGERYLAQAIDSLLVQTFQDYELIICDNCSCDATEEICRAYAGRDRRIRYYRNERNIGAAGNFKRVFELSEGEYFKWAAHDDLWAPTFLERCVEVLDIRPDVVLAHSSMCIIDENDQIVHHRRERPDPWLMRYDVTMCTDCASPRTRFYDLIRTDHLMAPIHGVFRTSTLKLTPLIGEFASSDVPLLARIGLLGRIYEVPEYLVSYREHPHQSIQLDRHQRTAWSKAPATPRIVFPQWRIFYQLCLCIKQVPLPWSERAWCFLYVLGWITWNRHWRHMGKDVLIAARQVLNAPFLKVST